MTTVLPFLFLKGNYLRIINRAGNEIVMKFNGIYRVGGDGSISLINQMLPVSVLIIIIPVLSFAAIFLFSKRKVQIKVVAALIIVTLLLTVLIFYYSVTAAECLRSSYVPGYKIFLIPLFLIFMILAYRGIRRDENLVSSYDRLR